MAAMTAGEPVQGAQPSRRQSIPQLKALRSMEQFYKLWQRGDRLAGQCAVSTIPLEVRKKKKQRFSEWKKAADVVERMVAATPSSSSGATAVSQVLAKLEKERIAEKLSMAAFIKALGKNSKAEAESA